MANEYLQRTPTSTGNRKVFTWSGWVKQSANSSTFLFTASPVKDNNTQIRLLSNGQIDFFDRQGSDPTTERVLWDPSFRDYSSWMHILINADTTKGTASDRVKCYVNGIELSRNAAGTLLNNSAAVDTPPQNQDFWRLNGSGYVHYIGANLDVTLSSPNENQFSDVFYIDGQQLGPEVFGYYKKGDGYISAGSTQATDFKRGQWVPKAPKVIKSVINARGGFGVNGFYLPMNDDSNFGADFHCEPNSIIKLKGEEDPQPRNGAPTTTDAYVSQLREDPYAANLVLAIPGIALENTNTELVTNGDFSNGTTGWTGLSGGSLSVEDGKLKITETTNALDAYAVNSTAITTVSGTRYTIKWTFHEGTNTTFTVRFGNSGNQSQEYLSNSDPQGQFSDPGTYSFDFEATGTQLNLSFIVNQANSYGYISNVSVKEAIPVRDYSADIKGSGTNKTLTVSGNTGIGYELGGYYGSALSFPYALGQRVTTLSNDFAMGTGDFTVEVWINPDQVVNYKTIFSTRPNNGSFTDGFNMWINASGSTGVYSNAFLTQTANGVIVPNQWTHVVAERYNNQLTTYVNGVVAATATNTQNFTRTLASLGELPSQDTEQYDGLMQDIRVYKGVAKYKGGFDVPKPYTPVGIESWRAVPDTTANNFATLNPLDAVTSNQSGTDYTQATHSNGNLTVILSDDFSSARGSIGVSSGKYYWEVRLDANTNSPGLGVVAPGNQLTSYSAGGGGASYEPRGDRFRKNGVGHYDGTDNKTDDGLIVGVALDKDAGSISFYADGALLSNGTMTGLNDLSDVHIPECFTFNDGPSVDNTFTWNFGQNPTFSGQLTAGTYTDSNGKGLFKYEPPSGFLALCEDNLPTPAIADPGEYFKTVLYTGSGSSRGIVGVGFTPDLVWVKSRINPSSGIFHTLVDSVRGAPLALFSNSTDSEDSPGGVSSPASVHGGISSFDNDGFSIMSGSSDNFLNISGTPYVAWCWKAGGAAVSNTDGTITSQVSANQTAGFSIVSYTGTGSAGATVGHGLGKPAKFILIKRRSGASNWGVGGSILGANSTLYLNLTNATDTFGDTNLIRNIQTSTTFELGTDTNRNELDGTHIAYCWAEIEGYSKFGSYVGNGSADGPFVYCGFKPAWVMIKNTSVTGYWNIWDSSRTSSNPCDKCLFPNVSDIEAVTAGGSVYDADFLSNGFKIRTGAANHINGSGNTIIFVAFAESPFQTANAK